MAAMLISPIIARNARGDFCRYASGVKVRHRSVKVNGEQRSRVYRYQWQQADRIFIIMAMKLCREPRKITVVAEHPRVIISAGLKNIRAL